MPKGLVTVKELQKRCQLSEKSCLEKINVIISIIYIFYGAEKATTWRTSGSYLPLFLPLRQETGKPTLEQSCCD